MDNNSSTLNYAQPDLSDILNSGNQRSIPQTNDSSEDPNFHEFMFGDHDNNFMHRVMSELDGKQVPIEEYRKVEDIVRKQMTKEYQSQQQ
jgi:hypothetical protein